MRFKGGGHDLHRWVHHDKVESTKLGYGRVHLERIYGMIQYVGAHMKGREQELQGVDHEREKLKRLTV